MTTETLGTAAAHSLWDGLKSEHERYREAVSYIPTQKLRLQEDLRRYLCLRCAGFLEQVTYVVLNDYLNRKAAGPTLNFASSHLDVPNLRFGPFRKLVGRFGEPALASFDRLVVGARKDALSDLFEVRNDIAHGKYHGGRKLDPERYLQLCEEIYRWLLNEFAP